MSILVGVVRSKWNPILTELIAMDRMVELFREQEPASVNAHGWYVS